MKSLTTIGVALVASVMMLTSCVSSKKYSKLEEDHKQLQSEYAELKAEKDELAEVAAKALLENELKEND